MNLYLEFSDSLISKIVSCVNRAVTQDIIEDLQRAGFDKDNSNSYYQRIWDYINKNVSKINLDFVITGYSKRGPWKLICIFDKNTGTIYTIMREKRFSELSHHQPKHVHYMQALAESFNLDIPSTQQTFFQIEINNQEVEEAVNRICSDLQIPSSIVKRHALILFESKNEILYDIRCCAVNGLLEVCESIDLKPYVNINENVVVEEVSNPNTKSNNPSLGLKLKDRAKAKKNTKENINIKDDNKSTVQIG